MSRRTWKCAILCAAMLLVLMVFWQAPVAPPRADSLRNGATQETPEEIAAQPADRRGEREAGVSEAGVSFQVRDLANGHPVVGIRIRARDGSDVATAETDQDGTVALPVTKMHHVLGVASGSLRSVTLPRTTRIAPL